MPPYSERRKTYCECCDSCSFCACKLSKHKLEQFPFFIDWDEEKSSRCLSWKSCDSIYDQKEYKIFFIEFKNFMWFFEHDKEYIKASLEGKFKQSHELYLRDGNEVEDFEYICAYNMNKNEKIEANLSSEGFQKRAMHFTMFDFLDSLNINLCECRDVFDYIVY